MRETANTYQHRYTPDLMPLKTVYHVSTRKSTEVVERVARISSWLGVVGMRLGFGGVANERK